MTTWETFLADLREDLQDTGATPRWSDKMLYLYAKDAIRDYSTWFPKRIDRKEIAPVDGAYPLPLDFIEEIYVECPENTYLVRRPDRPGAVFPTSTNSSFYYVQGGSLYLGSPRPDPVLLTYSATHPVPINEDNTTFQITVPDMDLELIRLYVKSKAYEQMRSRQAALDRFKLGSGKRDDNPVQPEVGDLMSDYYTKLAQRIPGGAILLYRRGRTR